MCKWPVDLRSSEPSGAQGAGEGRAAPGEAMVEQVEEEEVERLQGCRVNPVEGSEHLRAGA